LWCGIQMWGFGKRWWRVAAVTYPALQVLVVLATANHFFFDVLGGGACIIAGYAVVIVIGRVLGRTGESEDRAPALVLPAPANGLTHAAAESVRVEGIPEAARGAV
jgi:hypothetical protein